MDIDALKDAYGCFRRALLSGRVISQSWYTTLQTFRLSSSLSLRAQNPIHASGYYYAHFKRYLDEYLDPDLARWQQSFNQADKKALRYGIVQELVSPSLAQPYPTSSSGKYSNI